MHNSYLLMGILIKAFDYAIDLFIQSCAHEDIWKSR